MTTCVICHNRPAVSKELCITCAATYGGQEYVPDAEVVEEIELLKAIHMTISAMGEG